MQDVKIFQKIDVRNPIMLAAWPGMGNVALGAVSYLRRKSATLPFAEIDMTEFLAPDAVLVKDGLASLSNPPKNMFYYRQEPPVVIFESERQWPGAAGVNLMNGILGLGEQLGVRRVYTGAAFPLPVSHEEPATVYGVANQDSLRDYLREAGVRIMEGGQISGLNGLLLGYAAQKGMEAICLLATLPLYAVSFPNPKASKAIVEVLERILRMEVDMTELDLEIRDMDEKMAMVEERIKTVFPVEDSDSIAELAEERVPSYVMEKIERLFLEAKVDREKAYALKEELDRWNLYEVYEDRFLDLFKKSE